MIEKIIQLIAWLLHPLLRPRYARITSCPATAILKGPSTDKVLIKVKLFNWLGFACKTDKQCSLHLVSYETSHFRNPFTQWECSSHTPDGLHCFVISFGSTGNFSFSILYGKKTILNIENQTTVRVVNQKLDFSKSKYQLDKHVIKAGGRVRLTVRLLDEQDEGYCMPTRGSVCVKAEHQPEARINFESNRPVNELGITLTKAGITDVKVEINGNRMSYDKCLYDGSGSIKDSLVQVRPAEAHKIMFGSEAHSFRGDGTIVHPNYQAWVGVPLILSVKNVLDRFGNNTQFHGEISVLFSPENPGNSVVYNSSQNSLKLSIDQAGLYNLLLKVGHDIIGHNISRLFIVDEPPIEPGKCTYQIYAKSSNLKVGELVRLNIQLVDVQGNNFKGAVDLTLRTQVQKPNGKYKTFNYEPFNCKGSDIIVPFKLIKAGRNLLFLTSNNSLLQHTGTYLDDYDEEESSDSGNETILLTVEAGQARTVIFDEHAISREYEIRHPSHQLFISRSSEVKIQTALDLYGNETTIPEDITACFTPGSSDESLIFDKDKNILTLLNNRAGQFILTLNSNQNELHHNIKQVTVLKPSKSKFMGLSMYDYATYAQDSDDELPLEGLPYRAWVKISDDEMRFEATIKIIRNSDSTEMFRFKSLHSQNIIEFTPELNDLESDVYWLKINGIQTDAGIKVRGLDTFKDESIELIHCTEYDRIMCYHGSSKVHPRLICGDDNANLLNISRVADVNIKAQEVILDEEGVRLDVDSDHSGDVCDMIELLLEGKHYRRIAAYHDRKRRHFASQAQDAYENNDKKTASILKTIKEKHAELMDEANARAMDAYFEFHNRERPLSEIDLHDLRAYRNRAENIPGEAIEKLKERLNSSRLQKDFEWLEIIVGAGNHSQDGKPQIGPLVEEYLSTQGHKHVLFCWAGLKFDVINKGSLLITFKKYSGPEPCFGQFYCPKCDKVWWSRYSWSGFRQTCLRCGKAKSLPHKMSEQRPYFGPSVWKKKNRTPNPVHNEEICEKCQKLGFLCLNLNSDMNLSVAPYT